MRGKVVQPSKHRRIPSPKSGRALVLREDHPAISGSRSLFPSTVVHESSSPRVLIGGYNQRKIGKRVTKGPWKGAEIFTLTLEERATCPRSCEQWRTCYGNNMHFARRHVLDRALFARLDRLKARLRGFRYRAGGAWAVLCGDMEAVEWE